MGRNKLVSNIWMYFSYSKLRTLFNCPYQFQHRYVLFTPRPKSPILAVGSALHYLAHLNNLRPYRSAESCGKAWIGFWAGVLAGRHGTESFRSPSEPIAWKSVGESKYWFGRGAEIMRAYYERYQSRRQTLGPTVTIGKKSEYRLKAVPWQGFKLNGMIDRIDEYPDRVVIVDLKMGKDDPIIVASSFQPIFYQIGYESRCRDKYFEGKPLAKFVVENLITGEEQEILPGGETQLRKFTWYLREASDYIRSILEPNPNLLARLTHLHPRDASPFRFVPRLPRGLHCRNCAYAEDCLAWEHDHGLPPRDLLIERFLDAAAQAHPCQPDLPF